MQYDEMLTWLGDIPNESFEEVDGILFEAETPYFTVFLGTVMALDPCGRYHHSLSPNGCTKECVDYWDDLNLAAEQLGGWIESGEGDPCDVFFALTEPK